MQRKPNYNITRVAKNEAMVLAPSINAGDGENGVRYRTKKGLLVTFYDIVPHLGKVIIEYEEGKTKRQINLRTTLRMKNGYKLAAMDAEIGSRYFIGEGKDKKPVVVLAIEVEEYEARLYSDVTDKIVCVPLNYQLYMDIDGPVVKERQAQLKKKATKWDI
jgi:hypothetical protein